MAEIRYGYYQRKSEGQRDAEKDPTRQEFSENRLPRRNWHGQQQLHCAQTEFFCPKPHAHCRNEKKVKPRMPEEERNQVSHPAFKEATDQQSECGGQQEKDKDEDICNRGREIGPELPFSDSPNRIHAVVLVSRRASPPRTTLSRPSSIS